MKILVAGGAGYIGSCCVELLLDHGHEVSVFDSLERGHRRAVDPRASFYQGNLADRDAVLDTMRAVSPEGIIHFAAYIEVGESMRNPGAFFRNNVACGLNLADAAVACGVRKIVFSSTAAVYGMPENVPILENEKTLPINPYGESKLMFERILRWYKEIHGLQYTALRYFNASGATATYGEDHNPETHLIPNVLMAARGVRECIQLFGDDYPTPDGTCIRDYIHILDLADAHRLALESVESGSFNLGSGNGFSVMQIIEMAGRVTGLKIPVKIVPRRPGDPPRLISDSTSARQVLGWRPKHDNIEAIINSAWAWMVKHPDGYAD